MQRSPDISAPHVGIALLEEIGAKVKRSTRSEVNMKRSVENAKEGQKSHRKTRNTRITWMNFLAVVTVALVFGRLVGKRDS